MTQKCPHCGKLLDVDIEVTQATKLAIEKAVLAQIQQVNLTAAMLQNVIVELVAKKVAEATGKTTENDPSKIVGADSGQ